jgi:simple sugar transport system ATP-binding protein
MTLLAPRAAPPLLEARGITKRYPGVLANDGVDFSLSAGEIHAVLGENGAGKTTLMHVFAGLVEPDAGELRVDGQPVAIRTPKDAIALRIAMVHQHFLLVPVFTVAENVVLGAEPARGGGRLDRAAARARVRELAAAYGLAVEPEALVEDLPVGVQQRVEILKALYRDARILILDEPTAVLTPRETADLVEVLRRVAARGVGVVFITHKLGEVLAVADRVTVLRRGQVVATLAPRETDAQRLAALMIGHEVALTVAREPARPGDVVLRGEELRVRDARGLLAVDGATFEVRAGEVLGVAGVQGNGQSELVQALVGLRPLVGGRLARPGVGAGPAGPRAVWQGGTAHVPEDRQRDGLVLPFSVAENLILCSYYQAPYAQWGRLDPAAIAREARARMAEFDVRAPSERSVAAQLSGGNQQKVILARELSRPVRLVIANQPTRGLDVGSVEYVHRRLIALRDGGAAVLLVSTELDELLAVADRIAVLYRGRVVATLRTAEATAERLGLLMAGGGEAP